MVADWNVRTQPSEWGPGECAALHQEHEGWAQDPSKSVQVFCQEQVIINLFLVIQINLIMGKIIMYLFVFITCFAGNILAFLCYIGMGS